MMEMTDIDAPDDGSDDIELEAYLQKKTTKGFYVTRYFATVGHYLIYWNDKSNYDKKEKCSEIFDICEVKNIVKDGKNFQLMFMNSKFKLDLKAGSEEQCNEWTEVIIGKRSLYSVDELVNDLNKQRVSFSTKTFQSLMVLKEKEQNKWILSRLDEIFLLDDDEQKIKHLRSNPFALINAATAAINELLVTCEECRQETATRNPKVIAHCRIYMKRYADIVKGRITLELLYLPGIQEKKFEMLGERAICAAINLMTQVEKLNEFRFIPSQLVNSFNSMLFNIGQLISALINLSIHRVDAFMSTTAKIANPNSSDNNSPKSSSSSSQTKLTDIEKVIQETVHSIDISMEDYALVAGIISKIVISQLLSFVDQLMLITFDGYQKSDLIDHINACDRISQRFDGSFIKLPSRELILRDERMESLKTSLSANEKLLLPHAIIDAISSACFGSAKSALVHAVHQSESSVRDIVEVLLNTDKKACWVKSNLCNAYVTRLHHSSLNLANLLPRKYTSLLLIETARLIIKIYVKRMIVIYQGSNKRVRFTAVSIEQMNRDLSTILHWIETAIDDQKQIQVESDLVKVIIQFLIGNQDSLLQYYADAVLCFGTTYALHLYDLIRLVMKFRADFATQTRKAVLGLCGEYLNQLQIALENDPSLLHGRSTTHKGYLETSIFEKLSPQVGVEHCTGSKWRVETLPDALKVRSMISDLVNKTCISNETMSSKTVISNSVSSISQSTEPTSKYSNISESMQLKSPQDLDTCNSSKSVPNSSLSAAVTPPPKPSKTGAREKYKAMNVSTKEPSSMMAFAKSFKNQQSEANKVAKAASGCNQLDDRSVVSTKSTNPFGDDDDDVATLIESTEGVQAEDGLKPSNQIQHDNSDDKEIADDSMKGDESEVETLDISAIHLSRRIIDEQQDSILASHVMLDAMHSENEDSDSELSFVEEVTVSRDVEIQGTSHRELLEDEDTNDIRVNAREMLRVSSSMEDSDGPSYGQRSRISQKDRDKSIRLRVDMMLHDDVDLSKYDRIEEGSIAEGLDEIDLDNETAAEIGNDDENQSEAPEFEGKDELTEEGHEGVGEEGGDDDAAGTSNESKTTDFGEDVEVRNVSGNNFDQAKDNNDDNHDDIVDMDRATADGITCGTSELMQENEENETDNVNEAEGVIQGNLDGFEIVGKAMHIHDISGDTSVSEGNDTDVKSKKLVSTNPFDEEEDEEELRKEADQVKTLAVSVESDSTSNASSCKSEPLSDEEAIKILLNKAKKNFESN